MNTQNSIKNKHTKGVTTEKLFIFFVVFFLANVFIGIVLAAASGGDSWKYMLFHSGNHTDLFMDFYNSIRDGGSADVYSQRNNIYPPLCVLIFRLFSKLISPELVATYFSKRTSLQIDTLCTMIYFVFAIICVLSMVRLIESYINIKNDGKFKTQAAVISFMMIISHPVMFCLERGNILILSLIFSMFFFFFRDSENKVIKELSYISLACAAGIKLYPALFGLILVAEKKYKDALRLILYGIIIVVFPFIFFLDEFLPQAASIGAGSPELLSMSTAVLSDEGSQSVVQKLIENLISFTLYKKSSMNLSSVSIQNIIFMGNNSLVTAKIVCVLTEVIALVTLFFAKREWQKIFLLTYLMLNIPSASNSYALSFLIIPFIVFLFGNQKFRRLDKIFMVGFTLMLTPLPTLWYYHPEIIQRFHEQIGLYYNSVFNQNIGTFVFQFIFVLAVIDIISTYAAKRKKTKKNNELPKEELQA